MCRSTRLRHARRRPAGTVRRPCENTRIGCNRGYNPALADNGPTKNGPRPAESEPNWMGTHRQCNPLRRRDPGCVKKLPYSRLFQLLGQPASTVLLLNRCLQPTPSTFLLQDETVSVTSGGNPFRAFV